MERITQKLDELAHFLVRPTNGPNGEDPWVLEFVNGPINTTPPDDPSHTEPLILAFSDGGDFEAVAKLKYVAEAVAVHHQRRLFYPEERDYIDGHGGWAMMGPDALRAYPVWGSNPSLEDIVSYSENQ